MEISTNTINIDYLNLNTDYIIFDESSNHTIDTSIVTTFNTTDTVTFNTTAYYPTTITSSGNSTVYLDSTVDFNAWAQPGFLIDLGNNEDEVHYTHEEATETLKEQYIEKKLREEHTMLEKAYKEYKMLARLLQIDEERDE